MQAYIAQLDRLDAQAKTAYDREMARATASEKAGECPQAGSTRAIEDCLSQQIAASQANFTAFTGAIRSILALDAPGDGQPVPGPTGTPLSRAQRLQQFDDVAAAWNAYSKAQAGAAYDLWKGGTIAPVESLTCQLMLLRERTWPIEPNLRRAVTTSLKSPCPAPRSNPPLEPAAGTAAA